MVQRDNPMQRRLTPIAETMDAVIGVKKIELLKQKLWTNLPKKSVKIFYIDNRFKFDNFKNLCYNKYIKLKKKYLEILRW